MLRPIWCLAIAIVMLLLGCSSGIDENIITPDDSMKQACASSHQLWGLYQFTIDPDAECLDAVAIRNADMHLNALFFLEPPPLVNLTIENLQFNGSIIEVDVGLRHPFLGQNVFTGFDVAGIVISHGSINNFSDPELNMPGDGNTRLLNPDGYTRWWNPTEFPMDGTMFAYQDGLLGAPHGTANFDATLNGYKFYCDDLGPDDPIENVTINDRALFSAGQKNIRHYTIQKGDNLSFNYAVDASWQYPVGTPPYLIPDDFPPDANRAEPWRISVIETENSLYNTGTENGGVLHLIVNVFDHFDSDLNLVRVEAPGEITMTESDDPAGSGIGYSSYALNINNCSPQDSGPLEIFITVESNKTGYGGLLPGKPVSSYFFYTTTVSDHKPVEGEWSDEFVVNDWSACYPVIAQTPEGKVICAFAGDPGLRWARFVFPGGWTYPGTIDADIIPVRTSIAPGRTGDTMHVSTMEFAGEMEIAGQMFDYGHTVAYKWDGDNTWNEWDQGFTADDLMSHIYVCFEGKHHFIQGIATNYGNVMHMQYTNWGAADKDYPSDFYTVLGGNEHELSYSRAVAEDSDGTMYSVYESDRMKSTYWPPGDYKWLRIVKQNLPSTEYGDYEVAIIEEGDMDYLDSPCIAVDSTDRIYVVYRRYIDATSTYQIVLRWSDDGLTWSSDNEAVAWQSTMMPDWRYISIDIDSIDRMHLSFLAGGKLWYTRSSNGISWIPLEQVNPSINDIVGVGDHQQYMFVDKDNQAHVIWTRLPVIPFPKFGAIRHSFREA